MYEKKIGTCIDLYRNTYVRRLWFFHIGFIIFAERFFCCVCGEHPELYGVGFRCCFRKYRFFSKYS